MSVATSRTVTGLTNDVEYQFRVRARSNLTGAYATVTGTPAVSAVGWDISTATYLQSFALNAGETGTQGIFFKPDGTKMYTSCPNTDRAYEYDLSTAWDITTASYTSRSYGIGSNLYGLAWRADGTEAYGIDLSLRLVIQFSASPAWQYPGSFLRDFSVSSQDTVPVDVFFSTDGTQMYMLGAAGADINQYTLATPWNISTASYVRNKVAPASGVQGFYFRDDGLKMYLAESGTSRIYEEDLSTAWDISTMTSVRSYATSAQTSTPLSVSFSSDGLKMFVLGGSTVYQYSIG